MSSINKVFGSVAAMLVICEYGMAETNQVFTLKDGAFRCGGLEVKMLTNGVATISAEGRVLANCDGQLEWRDIRLPGPEISLDEKMQAMTMRFRFDKEGRALYTRQLKAAGNALELTTTIAATNGGNPGAYLPIPAKRFEAQVFVPENSPAGKDLFYDGGWWQSGICGGTMAPSKTKKENTLLNIEAASPVKDISFWQKDKTLGFSIRNTKDNDMTLYDISRPDRDGSPQVFYNIVMYSVSSNGTWRTTQIITPACRRSEDVRRAQVAHQLSLTVPFKERLGYFPVGYTLPIAITIASSKETAGDYTAEFLLCDQQDREVMKKEMPCSVTETIAGNVKYDFICPQQCALYWMRISVKDKSGGIVLSKEYPLAVTVKLPELKDIPASSPLGGQPLSGGRMPEGRLVGMKWDRFWMSEKTSWKDIEPEKGQFRWEETDRLVEEAVQAGNEILWCLCRTPEWASRITYKKLYDAAKSKYSEPAAATLTRQYPESQIVMLSPPKDIKDWENYVRAIVRRYKTKVHYWQIWNEPWWDWKKGVEIAGTWYECRKKDGKVTDLMPWEFSGTMEDYVALVKSAYKVIHAEDPEAKVVVFGDYLPREYQEKFYQTGVGDYIDVLCLHYFSYDYLFTTKNMPAPGWFTETARKQVASATAANNLIRDFDRIHFQYTGKHVPIWITEEGMSQYSRTGRNNPRPLTQKECEEIYGEDARKLEWSGPSSKMSERRHACWQTQAILFNLGIGADKVFLHSGFSISVPGMSPEGYKLPTESGIAWAAMASVLDTSKEVRYVSLGNNDLDAITITDLSGKKTTAIWSNTGRKISVEIPVKNRVLTFLSRLAGKALPGLIKSKKQTYQGMDFLGNPAELKAENGSLRIEAGEEPIYIYDLDLRR